MRSMDEKNQTRLSRLFSINGVSCVGLGALSLDGVVLDAAGDIDPLAPVLAKSMDAYCV